MTLCDFMDCYPPSSSVHGTFQARILEWVAMPSSRGSSQPRDWTQVSHMAGRFFTIWTTSEAQSKAQMTMIWFKNSKIPEKEGRHQDHLKVLIWGNASGRAIHWEWKEWRTIFWISEGESRIKNVLYLRCLVHIQVEMLNRQLDVTIWVQLRSLD